MILFLTYFYDICRSLLGFVVQGVSFIVLTTLLVLFSPIIFIFAIVFDIIVSYFLYLEQKKFKMQYFKREKQSHYLKRTILSYLEMTLTERSPIPYYLVTAYLYLSKATVYEIDLDIKSVIRWFQYETKSGKIIIHYTTQYSSYRHTDYIPDNIRMDPKIAYFNHIPQGILIIKDD